MGGRTNALRPPHNLKIIKKLEFIISLIKNHMQFKKENLYYIEGAVGTEILRRGFPTKLPLWSAQVLFENPELLKNIYKDYIAAGADIITTNTFRTQRRTLEKVGKGNETENINRLAVDIAVDARKESSVDRPVYIAGCMTTLEDCYRPDLVPSQSDLEKEHSMIGHPKAKTLFEMAWSDQRSDGLRAVAWRYEDLLQLVKP